MTAIAIVLSCLGVGFACAPPIDPKPRALFATWFTLIVGVVVLTASAIFITHAWATVAIEGVIIGTVVATSLAACPPHQRTMFAIGSLLLGASIVTATNPATILMMSPAIAVIYLTLKAAQDTAAYWTTVVVVSAVLCAAFQ